MMNNIDDFLYISKEIYHFQCLKTKISEKDILSIKIKMDF